MNPLNEGIWTSSLWIAKMWDMAISPIFYSFKEHLWKEFSNSELLIVTIIALLHRAYHFLWTLADLDILGNILVSLLKIVSILLFFFCLIILARAIFKRENGMLIMPFEVSNGNDGEKLNGRTISDLLMKELQRIQNIHDEKLDLGIHPLKSVGLSLPPIQSQNQTIAEILGQIGTIGAGGTSLPLGQLILAFKKLCPGTNRIQTIYGSFQNYGRVITVTARLEGNNLQTWYVNGNIIDDKSEVNISCLVRELSYKIFHDLAKCKDDYPVKTSDGLKHFTEAIEFYQKYRFTGNLSKLNESRDRCLEAIKSERDYDSAKAFLIDIMLAYINEDLYDEAEKVFRYHKILEPDLAAFFSGFFHWKQENRIEALQDYDRALRVNPKLAEAWSNKAVALVEIGKLKDGEEALDYFIKALENSKEALKINPKFSLALNNKASALIEIGRLKGGKEAMDYYNEAINDLKAALSNDPDLAFALNNKALALIETGKLKGDEESITYFEEAVDDCKKALKINPDLTLALNNKALALIEIGKLKSGEKAMADIREAIDYNNQALEKDPELVEALLNNGAAYVELGRLDANKEATDCFETAIVFYERSYRAAKSASFKLTALIGKSKALIELARLKNRMKPEEDFINAINACDAAIIIDPNSYIAWNDKGYALSQLGRLKMDEKKFEDAIKAYDNAIAINHDIDKDNYKISLFNKGNAYINLGNLKVGKDAEDNFKNALDLFNELIDLDSNNVYYKDAKEIVLKKLNQLSDTKYALDKAECLENNEKLNRGD
jgi:tetratricopeptide (TPR) repeat protein